jgi:ArsR family transcriptional regulator, arsenate/arsenite/antimonite-responsive transcriptional repressor
MMPVQPIVNSVIISLKVLKALADETRLRIFQSIATTYHVNCSAIATTRGVTPATVSHHLKILSEAGLIACRREGQVVYCEAVFKTIADYTRALMKIAHLGKAKRRTSFTVRIAGEIRSIKP